ncbi:MAG: DUF3179 domain-containing protein [Candidatus Accumulibacter sp.]|nr:DUF3179 domain-containing protein [Accumulibacter sp.]
MITRVRFSCPGMASETSVSVSCASRIAEAEDANGTPLASVVGYWFAWYAFHPETLVYKAATRKEATAER